MQRARFLLSSARLAAGLGGAEWSAAFGDESNAPPRVDPDRADRAPIGRKGFHP